MKIGNIDTTEHVLVIAEIGNNHEGSFETAERMIAQAAAAGADAVKFQTIDPAKLVAASEPARREQLGRFRFDRGQFEALKKRADKESVLFLSTPFDCDCVDWLAELVPAFKIASGDNNFTALLERVASTGKPVMMSTGMSGSESLSSSLSTLESAWRKHGITHPGLSFLHCVVSYPTPPEEAELLAIRELASLDGIVPGYSDHTLGIEAAILSVGIGARVVEKHFTLDKGRTTFRDHQLSADPADLKRMVQGIRAAEKLLGRGELSVRPCEQAALASARRSLAATTDLAVDHVVSLSDVTWLRPGTGIPVGHESGIVGKRLTKPVAAGHLFLEAYFV
jgi:N-acetylneuraminate synthase/N,N'-diacetyllegionaminate synthase